MTSILEGRLAKIVNRALAGIMVDLTYKDIDVQPRPNPPIEEEHRCKGFISSVEDFFRNSQFGSEIPDDTKIVVIMADSLAVTPKVGDQVTLAKLGAEGETLRVGKVEGDPAGATWTIQARPTR